VHVAVVADIHGFFPEVPACDVLLLGGDVCPVDDHDVERQARWLDGEFRAWLGSVPARHVVGIAGNHDFVFERAPERVPHDLPWTYLEDGGAEVAGLTIWGSPWTPWFFDWAFNAPRAGGEEFLAGKYATVGDDVDVLLLHGPPAGYGDRTLRGDAVGSSAELDLVGRVAPRLCVFGHIHEGRGRWELGDTLLLNAAAVDTEYRLRDDPVVVVEL
jgi:Calcineurin-like phosphoesterase